MNSNAWKNKKKIRKSSILNLWKIRNWDTQMELKFLKKKECGCQYSNLIITSACYCHTGVRLWCILVYESW